MGRKRGHPLLMKAVIVVVPFSESPFSESGRAQFAPIEVRQVGKPDLRVVPRIGEEMMASASMPRFRLIELSGGDPFAEFARDVAAGLTAQPKHLSCRY